MEQTLRYIDQQYGETAEYVRSAGVDQKTIDRLRKALVHEGWAPDHSCAGRNPGAVGSGVSPLKSDLLLIGPPLAYSCTTFTW